MQIIWLPPGHVSYLFFFSFFFGPILLFSPFLSCSLLVVTQIRGHTGSRLFSPLPITVRALHFYREKDSALFFPRRLATHQGSIFPERPRSSSARCETLNILEETPVTEKQANAGGEGSWGKHPLSTPPPALKATDF